MPDKKIHTTNYVDTFIEVAEDTKADHGTKPPSKFDKKTVAEMQYELIANNPYKFTSDDVLFQVFANRNDLTKSRAEESKGGVLLKRPGLFTSLSFNKELWVWRALRQRR
jgi:hypothetical protein